METDRSKLCGCKGIRTCLKCEEHFDIPCKNKSIHQESLAIFFYCSSCNMCYPGISCKMNPHPLHTGVPLSISGIYIQEDFLSISEEEELLKALDILPWELSQSGRRKQNFGPKCNFKKRKLKVGDFKGFPLSTKFIQDKLRNISLLEGYQTIEQCSLEYSPERGASIDPHIDDCWIWGERIVTVNLLSNSVLTLTPYNGNKYNLDLAPQEHVKCVPDVAIRIPMPARSLIVLMKEARYGWEHQVYRDDIEKRRVCIAYREFTTPYLAGGERSNEGATILKIAQNFF